MSRKLARENAYILTFEYIFSKSKDERNLDLFLNMLDNDTDKKYLVDVVDGVIEHYDELCMYITPFLDNFTFDRVYKTDLAAILLATYEMMYREDIPNSVSISEAIVLVKKFSCEKSNIFVNGVLSSVNKSLIKG